MKMDTRLKLLKDIMSAIKQQSQEYTEQKEDMDFVERGVAIGIGRGMQKTFDLVYNWEGWK